MTARQFPLRPESELVVWCAHMAVTDALTERIRQRVQEPLDRQASSIWLKYGGSPSSLCNLPGSLSAYSCRGHGSACW
jgi:hypothetical protein